MPMLDIQRRHAEVFRIRLGDKGPKGEPRKLTDSIRVTAGGRDVVQAFVDVYGGEAGPFDEQASRHSWQAYLPTTALSIMVLPGQSLDAWWELYRGSVCERRCDGFTEQLSGNPCMCPSEIDKRMAAKGTCRPMTRINVLCPDVEVVGAGSLVTHGMIAAETLPQSIAVAEAALSRGLMVPAVLRVVEHKGKRNFIYPQLEIVGVSLNQLTTGEVGHLSLAASSHADVPVERPAIGSGGPPSTVAAEVAAPTRTTPPPPLPGEDDDLPPAAESVKFDRAPMIERAKRLPTEWQNELNRARRNEGLPALTNGTFTQEQIDTYERLLSTQEENWARKIRSDLGRRSREFGLEDKDRHEFVAWVTAGGADGLTGCSIDQLLEVQSSLAALEAGEVTMSYTPEGVAEFAAVAAAS